MRVLCLAGLMLAIVAFGQLNAGMVTYGTALPGGISPGSPYNIEIDKFDTSLGTLTEVKVGLSAYGQVSGSTILIPGTTQVMVGTSSINVTGPIFVSDHFNYLSLNMWGETTVTRASINDPATVPVNISLNGFDSRTEVSQTVLDAFRSPDPTDKYVFTLENSFGRIFGGTALTNSVDGGLLSVTYTFAAASAPVPEPASIAMWSLMGGIGVMVRRKRKRTIVM